MELKVRFLRAAVILIASDIRVMGNDQERQEKN